VPRHRRRLSQGWSRTSTSANGSWCLSQRRMAHGASDGRVRQDEKEEIDIDAMIAASDSTILDVHPFQRRQDIQARQEYHSLSPTPRPPLTPSPDWGFCICVLLILASPSTDICLPR
jgi:hypothetical protein